MATNFELRDELATAAAYISTIAQTLDGWAEQSISGGWSTHQVQANTYLANSCRRKAASLRAMIGEKV